jgi:hypothetical protein
VKNNPTIFFFCPSLFFFFSRLVDDITCAREREIRDTRSCGSFETKRRYDTIFFFLKLFWLFFLGFLTNYRDASNSRWLHWHGDGLGPIKCRVHFDESTSIYPFLIFQLVNLMTSGLWPPLPPTEVK